MARIYGEILSSALMTFDKSFSRSNGQPLDSTEIYYSLAAAQEYAQTDVAYVGQKIVVIETADGVTKVTHYSIEADNSLKEIGTSLAGDEDTIVVAEDGTIRLHGIEGLELTRADDEGNEIAITYQPLYVNGKLTWVEPSATTVEGLAAEIEGLKGRLGTVEAVAEKIGELEGDKTVAEMIADATYDDTQVKADIQANADAIAAIEADYLKAEDKYDDTELAGRVTAVEGDVATIKGDYLKASDKTELEGKITAAEDSAVDRVLGYLAEEEVNAKFDTLKEIAAWIESDTTASAELVTKITTIEQNYLDGADKTELQDQIDELEAFVGTLPEGAEASTIVAYIKEVVDALNIGDYAKTSDMNAALAGKVDAADGYRLMSDAEGAKLEGIEEGAQVNKIETVSAEFELADRNLSIAAVDQSKVTGLADALAAKVDVVDGSRLMTEEEGTKLAGIEDGAEVNYIKSVDAEQFAVNAGNLTLLDIAMGKVTGLSDALKGKVDKIDGYRLMSSDEATKLEKLVLGEDGKVEVSGEINASNVKELGAWITNNRDSVLGLLSVDNEAKLNGIAAGAQVNVLEGVQVGGTLLDIVGKVATIPVATTTAMGVVLSSVAENKIAVATDGTMEVNSLNVNKLVQDEGTTLVLNGGAAAV